MNPLLKTALPGSFMDTLYCFPERRLSTCDQIKDFGWFSNGVQPFLLSREL